MVPKKKYVDTVVPKKTVVTVVSKNNLLIQWLPKKLFYTVVPKKIFCNSKTGAMALTSILYKILECIAPLQVL